MSNDNEEQTPDEDFFDLMPQGEHATGSFEPDEPFSLIDNLEDALARAPENKKAVTAITLIASWLSNRTDGYATDLLVEQLNRA